MYPNIEDMRYKIKAHSFNFRNQLIRSLKPISVEEIDSVPEEFMIDFSDVKKPRAIYKVKNIMLRNENRREEIQESDPEHLNVLRIFMDTVSRTQFHRKYKHTIEYLKKYDYAND